MDLVLFCHPSFFNSQSMPRFARMLASCYEARGHNVRLLSPKPRLFKLVAPGRLSKWASYFDQYVLFPIFVRRVLRKTPRDSLLVFCDQALGPWVPLAKGRPCVVHVHDLLALRSALGEVPENRTGLTGRIYQRYIRRGFRRSRHFISISRKTREDLHRFGRVNPLTSVVIYNGLNFPYSQLTPERSREVLIHAGLRAPAGPVLLHVGGGQWYKNLVGVLSIYRKYVELVDAPHPLWCISPEPSHAVRKEIEKISGRAEIVFLKGLECDALQALYSCAKVLLFPSLAEGFGWPLIEAQACGCCVLTTDEAPMNEVAGDAAVYIPRLHADMDMEIWAQNAALALRSLLAEEPARLERRRALGKAWAQSFDADKAIDGYLDAYRKICDRERGLKTQETRLDEGAEV